MSNIEHQIKMDANEILLGSKGFILATVAPDGEPRLVIHLDGLKIIEKTGILAWLNEQVLREIVNVTQSEKIKEYPDGDEEPEEFGPSLGDNLNP